MRQAITTPRIVQPGSLCSVSKILILLVLVGIAGLLWWPRLSLLLLPTSAITDSTASEALRKQVSTLENERDALRLRVVTAERTQQVDQAALAAVQQQMLTLHDERALLNREIAFLKSLVSGDMTVLQLLDLKVWQTESDTTAYRYSLTVSKRAKSGVKVRGTLVLRVTGQQEGQPVVLSMSDMGIKPGSLSMKFTHFQTFNGTFVLPDGFVPELIKVAVKPTNKQFRQYQKDILWRLVDETPSEQGEQ